MRESDLLNQIIRTLYPVCQLYRANAGSFQSSDGKRYIRGMPKGFPDLYGVILSDKSADGSPVPVFIECKVKPNKPTAEQTAFIELYRAGGCCAGVCYTTSEAWRLIRPHIKKEYDTYTEEVLRRWEQMQ